MRFQNRIHKPKTYKQLSSRMVKYANAEKLAKEVKLEENGRIDCIVGGDFIFGDFIEAFFVENNIHTKKMIISTLSMSQENIDSLKNLLDGGFVDKLDLNISDFFFSHERRNLIPYMYEHLDVNDRFQLAVSMVHTKIVIFETDGGKKVIIHGSANLRSSANIEQFTIEHNNELYDFHKGWIEPIIEEYSTINKAIAPSEQPDRMEVQKGKLWKTNEKKKTMQKRGVWDKITAKF